MASVTGALCVKAKASAEPRNGAVQGVASSVANTPCKKAPPYPSRSEIAASLPMPGSHSSKTPSKFRANTKTTTIMLNTSAGF